MFGGELIDRDVNKDDQGRVTGQRERAEPDAPFPTSKVDQRVDEERTKGEGREKDPEVDPNQKGKPEKKPGSDQSE